MGQVKGSTILARLAFFDERGGREAEERVVARLSPEFQEEIQQGVLASRWYPIDMFIELNRAMDQEFGTGDLSFIRELGRLVAKAVLSGVYKAFAKPGDPRFLFERAAAIWDQFYDSGKLTIADEGDNAIRAFLEDFAKPAREHCLAVTGWIEGNLEFAGAKEIEIEELRCRARGDDVCEFYASWK